MTFKQFGQVEQDKNIPFLEVGHLMTLFYVHFLTSHNYGIYILRFVNRKRVGCLVWFTLIRCYEINTIIAHTYTYLTWEGTATAGSGPTLGTTEAQLKRRKKSYKSRGLKKNPIRAQASGKIISEQRAQEKSYQSRGFRKNHIRAKASETSFVLNNST
jgi:hypothetical protein